MSDIRGSCASLHLSSFFRPLLVGLFYMPELWQNSGTFLAQNDTSKPHLFHIKPRPHPAKPLPFFWIKRKKGSKPHNVLVMSERHSEVKWCTRKERLQTKVEEKKSRHCTDLFTAFIRHLLTAYSNRWYAFRPVPAFVNQGVCGKSRHSFWRILRHISGTNTIVNLPQCFHLHSAGI